MGSFEPLQPLEKKAPTKFEVRSDREVSHGDGNLLITFQDIWNELNEWWRMRDDYYD